MAQYRIHARQNKVPSDERARQLSAKLAGAAQDWFNLEFSRQPEAATETQLAYGLCKAFGREYEEARALQAMYHVSANPNLGGAQRLRELNHQEERTR